MRIFFAGSIYFFTCARNARKTRTYPKYLHAMPRPKGKKRHPVNLTLPREISRSAAKLAFQNRESLSQLVSRLLEQYLAAKNERKAA